MLFAALHMSPIGTKRRKPRRRFTSAFGGAAEVHGPTATAAFDANDPNRSLGGSKSRTAVVSCCAGDVLSLFGQTDRFERLAAVIVIGGDWH
jgi:hypothetical protein